MRFPSPSGARRLAALVLATGACLPAFAASYTLVDLGTDKFPTAINDHEEISGTNRNTHAIVWRDGRWHTLLHRISRGQAINQHGDVAGDSGANPMLWRPGREGRMLPLPGGSHFGLGTGINDRRVVVGLFEADDATIRCFQWTPGAGSIDLGFMEAGDFCQPYDVNNAGQVTGLAGIDAQRTEHAFVYDQGIFHDLGTLPEGDESQGIAINDHGDVAGRAWVPPLDGMHYHAVKWPAGGEIVDLDPQGRYAWSVANGINDAGEVVGTVMIEALGDVRAVRFAGQHAVKLQSEVTNLDGWILEQASGVNDAGEIVGWGTAPDGRSHAFLLRPETR